MAAMVSCVNQAFLQRPRLGRARLRRIDRVVAVRRRSCRSGTIIVALLMEYLAVPEQRVFSSTELESLHPAVGQPLVDDLLEFDGSAAVQPPDESRSSIELTFIVVVAGSALELKIPAL
jgi:hypothetical protein